jgi:subtilisin family serine protease
MSIATSYESSLLQSAINEAWAAGKVIVAAAANSNTDTRYYPAAHNHVVSVAAINKSGTKASFSNYGDWVDVSAYGTGIYSSYFDDTYAYMSGTSMACPLVSGCFALLFAYDPTLTNELAVDVITTFASDVYTENPDYLGQLGSGIVNPYMALNGLAHSQPGDLDEADSDGSPSDIGLEPGPRTQG